MNSAYITWNAVSFRTPETCQKLKAPIQEQQAANVNAAKLFPNTAAIQENISSTTVEHLARIHVPDSTFISVAQIGEIMKRRLIMLIGYESGDARFTPKQTWQTYSYLNIALCINQFCTSSFTRKTF